MAGLRGCWGFEATAQDARVNLGLGFMGITTCNLVIHLVVGSAAAAGDTRFAGNAGSMASANLTRAELSTWFRFPHNARYRFTVASIREPLAGHSGSWWPWWLQ